MSFFTERSGELYVEDVRLNDIAEKYGTPAYVYSRAAFTQHYLAYAQALGQHPGMICYAVKANSNIALLNLLARLGAGFDIVSGGELERVLTAGGDPKRIVFSGVGKTAQEMAKALKVGIYCFNVESEPELELLSRVAQAEGLTARISLRVNPDVDAGTHPYISTGLKENKFGIDIDRAPAVYRRAAELSGIEIHGVDCHIGSQLTELPPFLDALDRLLLLIDNLAEQGITIRHLDLGGGLGVTYKDEQPPAVNDYMDALKAKIGDRDLALMFEPGRSIAANAGVLLTKVLFLKPTEAHNFAIIDAAMNDNIRPALYQAWQEIRPLKPRPGKAQRWDLVGPVCETGDFLGKDRELVLVEGDNLAVMSAGAYGFTMSSNYNTRARACELLVDGDQVHIIRERESFVDMIRGEHVIEQ
ncbi:diaminopimelate decarboxylase [Gilvimarinus sp. SDUM040013]|uniref:Diaminopimelate decarboxylase n=1 Tax=Gilvimarinus gilvus TaxID=3058038 RepID=A0ABU4S242_9GAMM|nr:diaminopimelate decarboxylase [Gilvimarinus sp. SDUM040013]MDO3384441.1 diaminopimelate decarboxylase [Gilvimarinus sp. SDUM040013]MDX6851090.1 diaminopimelate decarboxylase [Gilvimarinus sp. SDUM040013]